MQLQQTSLGDFVYLLLLTLKGFNQILSSWPHVLLDDELIQAKLVVPQLFKVTLGNHVQAQPTLIYLLIVSVSLKMEHSISQLVF
jgi:hypothetical protein